MGESDFREANMYLAEDRILCLGIFCQLDSKYTLKYIPDAIAKTDAIDNLIEFILQRRRWINSSWFALDYVLRNYKFHVQSSQHSWFTKHLFLPFNMVMAFLGKINMYILLSMYMYVISTSIY